ncbi:hypothetical protein CON64_15160 [Bacillus pseudomycoides]|nr:hypothetical protein CON64_15160 [Bacillus pseudomycoides]
MENHIKEYLVAAIVDDYNHKSENFTFVYSYIHEYKKPDITLMKLQSDFLCQNYLNVMDC